MKFNTIAAKIYSAIPKSPRQIVAAIFLLPIIIISACLFAIIIFLGISFTYQYVEKFFILSDSKSFIAHLDKNKVWIDSIRYLNLDFRSHDHWTGQIFVTDPDRVKYSDYTFNLDTNRKFLPNSFRRIDSKNGYPIPNTSSIDADPLNVKLTTWTNRTQLALETLKISAIGHSSNGKLAVRVRSDYFIEDDPNFVTECDKSIMSHTVHLNNGWTLVRNSKCTR